MSGGVGRNRLVGLAGAGAVAAGLAVGLYLWQAESARAPDSPSADWRGVRISADAPALAAKGAPLYREACAACHGADLEGAVNWRQPMADGTLPPPPHDATGHTWHHPDGFLFAYTKFGGQPFMPEGRRSAMPAFGDAYSDEEILAILSYIKSTWPEDVAARQARITEQASGG